MQNFENNAVIRVIHNRKSVRTFIKQAISKQQVMALVRAGMAAPTSNNKQPWGFIVINDRDKLDKLAEELPYAKMLADVDSAICVCGDLTKTLPDWEADFWIQDCSAATQNILLAAEALGLGAVWTALYPATDRVHTAREILEIPFNIVPLNIIPIGMPMGKEKPKNKFSMNSIHWDKW